MNNANELFDEGCSIVDKNYNVSNEEEAWKIVGALKLFIRANKLEKSPSLLKPKILMCLASCNYEIGNYTLAYNCALISNKEIELALKESPFDEYSTRKMLGVDNNNEIIEAVKTEDPKAATELLEDYVVETVETAFLRKIYPLGDNATFTKEKIKSLLGVLNHLKSMYYKRAQDDGSYTMADKSTQTIDVFKMPLYFVWEKYKFGIADDVWEEGEDMLPYLLFTEKLESNLINLIDVLRTETPFIGIEKDRAISDGLIIIYTDLLTKIQNGKL